MVDSTKNPMPCSEFESLLSEALDGKLGGEKLGAFQAHAGTCLICGPLLKEAEIGQHWLREMQDVDPPAELVNSILAATTGIRSSRASRASGASWWQQFVGGIISPVVGVARQPRFAMSFGMAFFSLSLTLNVLGVKLGDIRHVDLRPSAIKRTYYETSGRVVKYYENIRFVYEIESRVREFKRVTTPPVPAPQEKPKERKDNSSEQQEQPRQERNYSQGENQPVLAQLPHDPPVVTGNTHRRFV
jgi:hypothetical protein